MWLGREVAEWAESCSRRGRDTQILTSVGNSLILRKSGNVFTVEEKNWWNGRGGTGSEGWNFAMYCWYAWGDDGISNGAVDQINQ